MSTTDKLAQALRELSYASTDKAERMTREALAEYDASQSTREVTADAVTANALAAYTLAWDAKKNPFECMQAALAAAFPVLVQQVERLRAELEAVNGAIGGKYTFFKERHGVGHQTTKALSQLIDLIAKKRDVATAQAKQAEGV